MGLAEPKDTPQTGVELVEQISRKTPRRWIQVRTINAHKGGDVGDGVLRQPARHGGQEHVPRRRGERRVAGDHDAEGGREPAAVVRVGLNDHQWSTLSRAAASWFPEIGPADITPADYHSSPGACNMVRACSAASRLL